MIEKRFTRSKSLDGDCTIYDELNDFQFPSLPLGVSKIFCDNLNELHKENKELKQELQDFKDYVFSNENILCYSCVNCISKGIYEVECSEKGKVDVHTSCLPYWVSKLRGE